jgi:hypothetical protein
MKYLKEKIKKRQIYYHANKCNYPNYPINYDKIFLS